VAYSAAYYQASIEAGRVTVNAQRVTPGHVLRDGERIVHRAVRCRENPVLDRGIIRVVAESEERLVVSKPSSLPIHPCGSYRFNSLIALLREQGTVPPGAELHTTHRLDRLTSGLVIFAKTKAAARQVGAWFQGNEIRKSYLARVRGSFDQLIELATRCATGAESRDGVSDDSSTQRAELPACVTLAKTGRIRLCGFNQCVDRKVGKYVFAAERPTSGEEAKDAATEFEFVGHAPNGESVVRCFPATGRTHQIRVHLRHLGYPIANDSCYGGDLRHDPSLPLIPHVHQAHGGCDGAALPDEAGETTMHASGIFLHALTYALPDDAYTSETPPWAECG